MKIILQLRTLPTTDIGVTVEVEPRKDTGVEVETGVDVVPEVETHNARGRRSILLSSRTYGESHIPSPSASLQVWLAPVPIGFAQKLPPKKGPPTMFLPGVLAVFHLLFLDLII